MYSRQCDSLKKAVGGGLHKYLLSSVLWANFDFETIKCVKHLQLDYLRLFITLIVRGSHMRRWKQKDFSFLIRMKWIKHKTPLVWGGY